MSRPPVELLACPACGAGLTETADRLTCTACERTYLFEGDAPRLSDPLGKERASGLVGRAAASLAAIPLVYDAIQRAAGARKIAARLQPLLASAGDAWVVDVGAGTGSLEALLPTSARYLWVDPDPVKLRGFRSKSQAPAVLADATRIPLRDESVEWTVSVAVSHHLDEAQLAAMLDELRRVTTGRLLFLDAVVTPRLASRLLWRYDRGQHPRTAGVLRTQIERRFTIATQEEFTVLHTYLLVTAT